MKHTSLSFDGFGINSASAEFCPRLATFVRGNEADNAPLDEAERQRLGNLFAAAPDLLAALEHCLSQLRAIRCQFGVAAIGEAETVARAAIARATGGNAS